MGVKAIEFRNELMKIITIAKEGNKEYVDVKSGDLHSKVGGYPGKNHSMPSCCSVMRQMMGNRDVIVNQPPKGNGATLIIRYYLG